MIPQDNSLRQFSPFPPLAMNALHKEKVMIVYQRISQFLDSTSPEKSFSFNKGSLSSPSSFKMSNLWKSKQEELADVVSEGESLEHAIHVKKSYQSKVRVLFTQAGGLGAIPEEKKSLLKELATFTIQNQEEIQDLEHALSEINEKIKKISPASSPTTTIESDLSDLESRSTLETSSPVQGEEENITDLLESVTLKNPPANPYTKEVIRGVLQGKGGVNQEILAIGNLTVLNSLVEDGKRSVNISYQKEGTVISINDVDEVTQKAGMDEGQIENLVKQNIINLYEHVGSARMTKIASLLSHGCDALMCKAALKIPVSTDYPELGIDAEKVRLGGKQGIKIIETDSEIILEKATLLELQEMPSDEHYSEKDVKSCYVNAVFRVSIPLVELDRKDFLTIENADSNIQSSLRFSRPCLMKEAAVACSDIQKFLNSV